MAGLLGVSGLVPVSGGGERQGEGCLLFGQCGSGKRGSPQWLADSPTAPEFQEPLVARSPTILVSGWTSLVVSWGSFWKPVYSLLLQPF